MKATILCKTVNEGLYSFKLESMEQQVIEIDAEGIGLEGKSPASTSLSLSLGGFQPTLSRSKQPRLNQCRTRPKRVRRASVETVTLIVCDPGWEVLRLLRGRGRPYAPVSPLFIAATMVSQHLPSHLRAPCTPDRLDP